MSLYKKNNGSTAIILTFLFPFVGLIYSLANWRQSWAKNAFWLACIYFGAVLIYWPEGTTLGTGIDGGRYVLRLMDMYNSSISLSGILESYLVDQDTMDLYFPIVAFLVSRFTDNGHVLFGIFAIVFGFFYSRNMWFVLEKLPNKKIGYFIVLIALFFLSNPISNVNGVRFNTAIHVFLYSLLPYLYNNDKSKLWWLLVVPLIHFSFLYAVVFAFAYIIIPHRIKDQNNAFVFLALLLFIGSFFLNVGNLSSISSVVMDYSPDAFEERIDLYTDQEYAEANAELRSLQNWYVGVSGIIINWSYNILMVLLYPCLKRNFSKDRTLYTAYTFAILFGTFANFASLIQSGGRFQILSHMFMVALILIITMGVPINDKIRKYVNIALIPLIIPMVLNIRRLCDFFSITAVFGNFITVFFWENNVPLIDFIKRVI